MKKNHKKNNNFQTKRKRNKTLKNQSETDKRG